MSDLPHLDGDQEEAGNAFLVSLARASAGSAAYLRPQSAQDVG